MYELGMVPEKSARIYIKLKAFIKVKPLLEKIASPKLYVEVRS